MNTQEWLLQSWRQLKGMKLAFWAVSIGWLITLIFSTLVVVACFYNASKPPHILVGLACLLLLGIIFFSQGSFLAGLFMVAIKKIRQEPISIRTGFQFFPLIGKLFLGVLCITLIVVSISFLFDFIIAFIEGFLEALLKHSHSHLLLLWKIFSFVLEVVVISLAYSLLIFVIPLIADKKMGVFRAISVSIKAVKPFWIKLSLILIIFNLISILIVDTSLISFLILIVLWIWLVPFLFSAIAVAYHHLIDREQGVGQAGPLCFAE